VSDENLLAITTEIGHMTADQKRQMLGLNGATAERIVKPTGEEDVFYATGSNPGAKNMVRSMREGLVKAGRTPEQRMAIMSAVIPSIAKAHASPSKPIDTYETDELAEESGRKIRQIQQKLAEMIKRAK